MKLNRAWNFLQFLIYLHFCYLVHSFDDTFNESLDAILRNHTLKSWFHPHPQTGSLYNASLPGNLAGMKISVVRLRSKSLWRKGANFSGFHIPPRTLPKPYVKRLLIVYHDLGNLSTHYYNITGYSLITSVVGFMVYDASSSFNVSNLTKIAFNTMGTQPISIEFHDLSSRNSERTKCATFDENGKVFLSDMIFPDVCYSRNQGHFSIVMRARTRRKENIWGLWFIGFLLGFAALVLVGLVGGVFYKVLSSRRTHEMEKEAVEGEVLETVWIHGSKLPRATVTRSHPTLESIGYP